MGDKSNKEPARSLKFDSLEDAVAEAERLLASGYEARGKWSLAQACGHCSQWLQFGIDGKYPVPLFLKPVFFVVSRISGQKMLRKIIDEGRMSAGMPTAPATVPLESKIGNAQRPAPEDVAAVKELREVVERFNRHSGPIARSPVFGEMDKTTAQQLHRVHMAHHLGFLVPK